MYYILFLNDFKGFFIIDSKCLDGTAQKKKFSIKDFFSKRDQTRRKLRIWSHLLKKSLVKNFLFVQFGNMEMMALVFCKRILTTIKRC